jgi:glycosyltransferase involved in cell wall biosynthesis
MEILYIIHQFYPESFSGTERFLLHLASSIRRSGHHPRVVTYSFGGSGIACAGDLTVKEYEYCGISVTAVRHRKVPIDVNRFLQNPSILAFANQYLRKNSCDVLHIAHPMRMAPFGTAALQLSIPYVLTLTDFWLICPKVNLRTSFDTLCLGPEGGAACSRLCPELQSDFVRSRLGASRDLLFGADSVVAPSRFLAALVKREFPDLRIATIPHGLPLDDFKANRKTYDHSSRLTFGYCGGLARHKGVHILLHAFRSLNSTAKLRVYGGAGEQEQDYERQLRDIAGDDPRISFLGKYGERDIKDIFQSIDVLVLPSLCYESYSLVLHEAFASNVPIIASDVGSINEKISEVGGGFVFRMGDQADLQSKLALLVEEPTILNELKNKLESFNCPLEEEESYLYERIYQTALGRVANRGR